MSHSSWSHGLQQARLPCPYQLREPTQTHVHWVGDAIQPCHPLSPLLPPSIPSIRVFSTSVQEVENNGMDLKHLCSRKVPPPHPGVGRVGKCSGGGCFNIKQKSKTQNRSLRTEIVSYLSEFANLARWLNCWIFAAWIPHFMNEWMGAIIWPVQLL